MSAGQKIAVSLLVSVILFAAFAVAAFAGLFSLVEARFYQPLIVKSIEQRLATVAEKEEEYSEALAQRFAAFTASKDIASYASASPTDSAQKNRTRLTGTLFSQTPSLTGIRIIDKNGRNIHFSSFAADEKFRSKSQVSYKNYTDLEELSFDVISCEDVRKGTGSGHRIVYDQKKNHILYAYPFYDAYAVYRGTIVFYCDADDFNRFLTSQNIIALNENFVLVSSEVTASQKNIGGYVCGLPVVGKEVLTSTLIEKIVGNKATALEKIAATEDGNWLAFILFNQDGSFIARFIKDETLLFSLPVRILLLTIVFLTLFLVIFLIFNLRHDDMVVIKDRIRRFQVAFIEEYTEKNKAGTLKLLPADLERRKLALNTEIKQSLGKRGKRHEAEVTALLDRNWNEIMGRLAPTQGAALTSHSTDTAEIKRMLEEVLGSGRLQISSKPQETPPTHTNPRENPAEQKVAPLEEAEGLAEAEEVDEVEPLDEVEEAEETEPLEEVDEVEPIEEAEPLDEAEVLEEAEEVDEAEVLEEVESLEEAEEVDEAESLEEAEEADKAESLEEAEELAEVEEVDEVEPLDEVEEAEETEPLEEVDEVEPIEEAEPLDEAEVLEEAEETDEAESLEEVESLEKAEEDEPTEEIVMMTEDEALTFSSPSQDSEEDADDDDLEFFEVVSPKEMFATNTDRTPVPSREVIEKPLHEPEDLPVLESTETPTRSRFSFWNFGRNDTPVTEVLTDSEETAKSTQKAPAAKEVTASQKDATPLTEKAKKPADTIQEDASGIYHIADNLPLDSMKLDEKFKQLVDSVLG